MLLLFTSSTPHSSSFSLLLYSYKILKDYLLQHLILGVILFGISRLTQFRSFPDHYQNYNLNPLINFKYEIHKGFTKAKQIKSLLFKELIKEGIG